TELMQSITTIPRLAVFNKAVSNLKGVVIPIIDLRVRIGIEPAINNEATRIIIVYMDDVEVGLIVDSANDVIDIPEDAIEPTPEVVGAIGVDYIEGVVNLESRLL